MDRQNKLQETKTANKIWKWIPTLLALSPAIYGIYFLMSIKKSGVASAASVAIGIVETMVGLGFIGLSVLIFIIWGIVVLINENKQKKDSDQPLD